MIGRDNQERLIPVALGFDPSNHGLHRLLPAEDGADGVVEVVVVQREVDVAGLDEEDKRLGERAAGAECPRARAAVLGRRFVLPAIRLDPLRPATRLDPITS
jgi:hypothetical protein